MLGAIPERYLATLDHEELLVRRGERSGLYTIVAVHSTARGPALGGCRMWSYADSRSGMRDAMRLSRAMTYKSAVAGLPLGGGKGVIMLPDGDPPPTPRRRRAALLDFGDTVERLDGRYITAEDVGISSRDMTVIAQQTKHLTGLSRRRGGSGDPSPYTAMGVQAAIEVACERVFGSGDLRGRSIAVLGLGHVGGRLAQRCARAGADLVLSDIDGDKRALAEKLGARWVDPAHALFADVDVVAPCALGAILDHESIPRLRCAIVAGSANNQLAEDSLGDLVRAHGILWAPDFVANAGGLINVATELAPGGYSPAKAREKVAGIADILREIFAEAERTGTTPLLAATMLARRRLGETVKAQRSRPAAG